MPLTLRPNITSASRHFDHLVMSGELCVGRIYKREPATSPETQWLWAINGVQPAGSDVMRLAGMSTSLDEAQAQLTENWRIRATSRRSVARKLLVIANAVIRDGRAWDPKMAAAA